MEYYFGSVLSFVIGLLIIAWILWGVKVVNKFKQEEIEGPDNNQIEGAATFSAALGYNEEVVEQVFTSPDDITEKYKIIRGGIMQGGIM